MPIPSWQYHEPDHPGADANGEGRSRAHPKPKRIAPGVFLILADLTFVEVAGVDCARTHPLFPMRIERFDLLWAHQQIVVEGDGDGGSIATPVVPAMCAGGRHHVIEG